MVYCLPGSLPELTEALLETALRTPRSIFLGDHNVYVVTALAVAAQNLMATTMGISQNILVPTRMAGHTLVFGFLWG